MLVRSDLDFILKQIKIAEAHVAGTPLQDLIPNIRLAYGLRSVDGSENNLLDLGGFNQTDFGAADTTFPRLLTPVFHDADPVPAGLPGRRHTDILYADQRLRVRLRAAHHLQPDRRPDRQQPGRGRRGVVQRRSGRRGALVQSPGSLVASPGLDGVFGTADDKQVYFIPNVKPDFGLTAPFNAWMTFFGQFFDHGLDLVTKGGSGTIFIPLKPDDPLYVAGLARPTSWWRRGPPIAVQPGPDGVLGTADDIHEQENTTTPFVDQNQTYTSHPSHQVFLRAYVLDADGHPVATGKLITNKDLGADGSSAAPAPMPTPKSAAWRHGRW